MHLTTCSKATARPLYRALQNRFGTHEFSIIADPASDQIEIHAERIPAFGAGRDGFLMQGFVEGYLAAKG